MGKGRRDCIDVLFEILTLAESEPTRTQLMYRANLNSHLAKHYINPLAQKDYLCLVLMNGGPPKYMLTQRGRSLLQSLDRIRRELIDIFPENTSADMREFGHEIRNTDPRTEFFFKLLLLRNVNDFLNYTVFF